jgi:hypothetical protein
LPLRTKPSPWLINPDVVLHNGELKKGEMILAMNKGKKKASYTKLTEGNWSLKSYVNEINLRKWIIKQMET